MMMREPTLVLLLGALLAAFTLPARAILSFAAPAFAAPAFAAKEEGVDQLIARAESARPEDRPALYLEIAHLKVESADKLYNAGNPEAGNASLQDVLMYSKKATDGSIDTGKRLKASEIALRKMAEKLRDVKRTVAFEDQSPIQQTIDQLEQMRTDLLSAMFGKKKAK
jgi:hypothetical protein